jgi:hypothetical protein
MRREALTADRSITIPVVIPLSFLARLNALALEREANRSELVREALSATFFTAQQPGQKDGDGQ